jgi:hypothetical protein
MSAGDTLDNPLLDRLPGELVSGPMADRNAELLGRVTGERYDGGHLLRRERWGCPGPVIVGQDFPNTSLQVLIIGCLRLHSLERLALQRKPLAPAPDALSVNAELPRLLDAKLPLGRPENYLGTFNNVLGLRP